MKFASDTELTKSYFKFSSWLLPIALAAFLATISFFNFLFFHTLAEFFAITVAILTAVIAWQMYPFTRNNYLMYLGVGYFWIGVLDLMHTLNYKGMDLFADGGSNTAVQIWIGTRYLEAILLVSAPWFLKHTFNRNKTFLFFGVSAFCIIFLVKVGLFPDGFIEGKGLTPFKIYSEYFIIFLLVCSIYYLIKQRALLEPSIVNAMVVSIVFTVAAELSFTFYVSVYSLSNIAGHLFKLFSFWLIFMAVIRTTLKEPFLAMSRGANTYDAIPDATVVVDENGIIRQVNQKAQHLLKENAGMLIGKENHGVFHPKNLTIESCPVCQAIVNNEELTGLELEFDGKGRWFDYSLSRITGASDLNGTVEVVRDITVRKKAEEKISELDILKNSIIENLPLMLFVKDAKNKKTHDYMEWNKAAEELTGILKENILDKNDFDFWPKEEAEFFIKKDNEVMEGGQLLEIDQEQITTKYKGVRTLHTKKIPIFDKKGEAKYLLGLSEDITEKLKTEEILSRSQKMDAVGQMSGGIAHDFNNQLGIILGYADLLSEQTLSEAQLNWIEAVRVAASRCADLTKQLLIFSRNGEVDKKVVNVNSLLSDMEVIIERSLTPAINIKYFKMENLWQVEVNAGACTDSILNLILNARDAMPEGGALTIETSNIILDESQALAFPNISAGEYVEVMVADTGNGMTQDVYDHVFEPFFTTKGVGKGTGLGLSMVYGFVHRYGGDIALDTAPGEGATFRIYIPRSVEAGSRLDDDLEKYKDFPKGHENILIVDDEVALLNYAEQLLKGWGYKVFCAKNAADALTILEHTEIDLLFSDVVMPGSMNGYALAEKVSQKYPKLKVLITSGFADKESGNEKYAKYGFELIPKPYDRGHLAQSLRQLLDE